VFIFVASGRYSHMTLGVANMRIIMGTITNFQFGEKTLGFEWGIYGFDDGTCGLLLGFHTHKEILV
jgi:hypothetical protein